MKTRKQSGRSEDNQTQKKLMCGSTNATIMLKDMVGSAERACQEELSRTWNSPGGMATVIWNLIETKPEDWDAEVLPTHSSDQRLSLAAWITSRKH